MVFEGRRDGACFCPAEQERKQKRTVLVFWGSPEVKNLPVKAGVTALTPAQVRCQKLPVFHNDRVTSESIADAMTWR